MFNGLGVLKLVHVLLAIVAVGYNATYGVILGRAGKAPRDTKLHALQTIRLLDRIANWAYLGLLLTGGALVTFAHYRWAMLWTGGSAILLVVALGVAHGLYTPTLKAQIRTLDQGGSDSPAYKALEDRGTRVGIALMIVSLAIVGMMVLKPGM